MKKSISSSAAENRASAAAPAVLELLISIQKMRHHNNGLVNFQPRNNGEMAAMERRSYGARVTENGKTRNYIKGAMEFLESCGAEGEISLTARGRSINKLVTIVEIIKKHDPLLQQTSEISWEETAQGEEKKEEGLGIDEEENQDGAEEESGRGKRYKSVMTVTLRRIAEERELSPVTE